MTPAQISRSLLAEAGIASPNGVELHRVEWTLRTFGRDAAVVRANMCAGERPPLPTKRVELEVSDGEV